MAVRSPSNQHWLSQHNINLLNFFVALFALLLALPSAINQVNELVKNSHQLASTESVHYSPTPLYFGDFKDASNCVSSLVSQRSDAVRCFVGKDVLDPCFAIPDSAEDLKKYNLVSDFSCPKSLTSTSTNISLVIANDAIDRSKSTATVPNKPWLITLGDSTECRLVSGAVGLAYGTEGNYYQCNGKTYDAVTGGKFSGEKYFAECKLQYQPVFKPCYVRQIVY